jgi:hypothetical protein
MKLSNISVEDEGRQLQRRHLVEALPKGTLP